LLALYSLIENKRASGRDKDTPDLIGIGAEPERAKEKNPSKGIYQQCVLFRGLSLWQ
jgi:hypothetical protein